MLRALPFLLLLALPIAIPAATAECTRLDRDAALPTGQRVTVAEATCSSAGPTGSSDTAGWLVTAEDGTTGMRVRSAGSVASATLTQPSAPHARSVSASGSIAAWDADDGALPHAEASWSALAVKRTDTCWVTPRGAVQATWQGQGAGQTAAPGPVVCPSPLP